MTNNNITNKHITRLLIANRGEIAVRINLTAKKMGITTIGLTTKAEPETVADEKAFLEGESLSETYLNAEAIIELALKHNAHAIHPGYGFLSENAEFARKVEDAKLIFIGPSPLSIEQMGNKIKAREIAAKNNIPITNALLGSEQEILAKSSSLSYPLLIKAAAGGGGKGMVKIEDPSQLAEKLHQTAREARNYFGDGSIYVEQYIENPHHIEVQVVGDKYGNIIHLFERECSIQRRYQKIIEEAPSCNITPQKREELTTDAIGLCKAIGYYNAGTVEFLIDKNGKHYFLEMNTRLQVEHPVTESITGLDLVELQINIAMGKTLDINQENIAINGHAIESRIYAEDALNNFKPAPGNIESVQWPSKEIARTDTWFNKAFEIKPDFDPMLAKIITHADSRNKAIDLQIKALEQTHLMGSINNLHYLSSIYISDDFRKGHTTTGFCTRHNYSEQKQIQPEIVAIAALLQRLLYKNKGNTIWQKLGFWRISQSTTMFVNDKPFVLEWQKNDTCIIILVDNKKLFAVNGAKLEDSKLFFSIKGEPFVFNWVFTTDEKLILEKRPQMWTICQPAPKTRNSTDKNTCNTQSQIKASIPGKITEIKVKPGDSVESGASLVILEAMKMENHIYAQSSGIISKVMVTVGQQVKANEILIEIKNSETK